jgi:cytochrome P450
MTVRATSGPRGTVDWDPYEPPPDPYPVYRELRDRFPVYSNARRGFWALSRFEDVRAANKDWERFSYAQGVDIDGVGQQLNPGNFLDADPPIHTVLRAIIKHRFRIGPLRAAMTPVIEAEVDGLLAGLKNADGFDFGRECAWELPIRVGARLLGFPSEDCSRLRALSDQAFLRSMRVPVVTSAADATRAVRDYFEEQIQARRRQPRDDMLTQIAHAELDGKPLGDAAAGVAGLIFGGSVDTTALMLTSAVSLLAAHPEQRAWLSEDLSRVSGAVEETLRFEAPIQVFKRTATRDVELHGTTIPAGGTVMLIYGSANRDERQFDRADRYDVRRRSGRHLAFGEGIHHCIGAPLARLEAEIALRALLQQAPDYSVADAQRISPPSRGFRQLWLRRE